MIKVLDQGYVKLIKCWGTEEEIIEAARMSTQKPFLGWDKDQKLLQYLYRNKHFTPFEMVGMTIEVKAPIFVFREWHRHRTQSYNEMSGRYIEIPKHDYLPSIERIISSGEKTSNKQSSGSGEIGELDAWNWTCDLLDLYNKLQNHYEKGLELGISRELARICLPVGRYSVMRSNTNLRNWLHFLTLRTDQAAQYEIREYASAVLALTRECFPRTIAEWELANID